jgi:hypothetical protein
MADKNGDAPAGESPVLGDAAALGDRRAIDVTPVM